MFLVASVVEFVYLFGLFVRWFAGYCWLWVISLLVCAGFAFFVVWAIVWFVCLCVAV